MMSEVKNVANAIGGKTARACDSCLRKRARWYCTADDAFLCQGCDATVHSANQLASRHQRVRLKSSSCNDSTTPAWHQGFTRKARTPRHGKPTMVSQRKDEEEEVVNQFHPIVPEICSEDVLLDESEELLLYRVPIFIPFADELCHLLDEVPNTETNETTKTTIVDEYEQEGTCVFDDLPGFLPSDMDLAEFAADVECFLAGGNDEESNDDIKECKHEDGLNVRVEGMIVRVKDEEDEGAMACRMVPSDMRRETMDWSFDYELPEAAVVGEEEEEEKVVGVEERKIFLRLNYEEVISAWASQRCPWTDGSRPKINPSDECWPGFVGEDVENPYRGGGGIGGQMGSGDGDREARVTRYREKRRTRLFAKKIRYQVRKLNAEKRPRMKGRFVKRSSFPSYLNQ